MTEIDILKKELDEKLSHWLSSEGQGRSRLREIVDKNRQAYFAKEKSKTKSTRARRQAFKLLDREWDEADHPRDEDGKFTFGGGGDGGGDAGPTSVFISPATGDLKFSQAASHVKGPRQQALQQASTEIDRALGKPPSTHTSVIGAWRDGAENSLLISKPGWTRNEARLAGAMKGWLADQKSVLVFQPAKTGDSFMATFEAQGKLDDLHNDLLKAGLENHTLEPTKGGALVHVYGDNQATLDKIDKAAGQYDTKAQFTAGHGEFIGTSKTDGSDREQRDDAREQYDAIISEAQTRPEFSGRDIGQAWDDIRASWGRELSKVTYSPGPKTPPYPSPGDAVNVKSDWIAASPIKSIDDVLKAAGPSQAALGEVGRQIQSQLDVRFSDPGPKTKSDKGIARVVEKAEKRGGRFGAVTDVARASFIVNHPDQAEQVITELGKHFEIAVEPWKLTDVNYGDRAVNIRFPNGLIGEVQIMDTHMAQAKSPDGGGGHDYYLVAREAAPDGKNPDPERYAAATEAMRQIYGRVLDSYPQEWKDAFELAQQMFPPKK